MSDPEDGSDSGSNEDEVIDVKSPHHVIESIHKYYENLVVDEEIKSRANDLYLKMRANHFPRVREDSRRMVAFYCLYHVLLKERDAIPPVALGSMMNITKGNVTRALTSFSKYNPDGQIVIVSPIKFLRWYMRNASIDLGEEHFVRLEALLNQILQQPEAQDAIPQNIVQGLLFYYLTEKLERQIHKADYAKMIGISAMTLNNIYSQITRWLSA